MTQPYYLHPAGFPSKWGVVDVGLKCMHSCKFCYYSFLNGEDDQFTGMRHADFHTRDHLITLVESLADNGFNGFDVTGGEPTLHPNMAEVIKRATELGLSSRIITLGQYLMRKMHKSSRVLLDDLLEGGLTNFLFSMHDIDEERFHKITGESWAKLRAAMNELDTRGFHYCSNTTVFEENYRFLPDIAEEILKHNIYLHNFILMNAYYSWSDAGRAAPVQADYHKVYPYLKKAIEILDKAGVAVNIRYAPHCTVPGLEKHVVGIVGVRFDPYEWMNNINHTAKPEGITPELSRSMGTRIQQRPFVPSAGSEFAYVKDDGFFGVRGGGWKVFPKVCGNCQAVSVCDGVDQRYVKEKKPALIPYTKVRGEIHKDTQGQLFAGQLDVDRLNYRGPFLVKLKPEAKMKEIVRLKVKPVPLPENPTVSIIIPCYNQGKYLERAINSALAQTYPCNVMVVDDCSTDNTVDLNKKFDNLPNLLWYRVAENGGQPAITRNRGIGLTQSDLVLCLDADDWIEPTMVEECIAALRANPHASIAYPGTQTFGKVEEVWPNGEWKYQNHLFQNQFVYCSLYKREIWEAVGGYRTNVKGCEDFDFWVAAATLGYEAVPVQRALFHYRANDEGLFESEVKPNFEKKYRQLILNNKPAFPPGMVKQAAEDKPVDRIMA